MAYLKHRKHGIILISTSALEVHPDLYAISDEEAQAMLGVIKRNDGPGKVEEPGYDGSVPNIPVKIYIPSVERYAGRWYKVTFADGTEIKGLTKEEAEAKLEGA